MHQGTLNNPHLTWGSRSSAFCWTHARAKHRKASERRSLSLSRNSRVAGTSSTINEMAIMAIMAIWIAHICSRLLTLVQCSAFLWMGHCRLRVPTSSCCNICCTSWSFCLEHCILRTRNQEQPRHWESMGECWAGLQIPGLEVKQHVTTVTTDIGWLLCFKTTSRHRNLPFEILVRGGESCPKVAGQTITRKSWKAMRTPRHVLLSRRQQSIAGRCLQAAHALGDQSSCQLQREQFANQFRLNLGI
jgi:hypothetical protein